MARTPRKGMDRATRNAEAAAKYAAGPNKLEEAVMTLIAEGLRPPEIARRLAPDDDKKRKVLRQKIWKLVRSDAQFKRRLHERAAGEVLLGMVPATRGLAKRASRKTDAAKLVFEMTGLHNTKVKHEHSGEVKISFDIPRPKFDDGVAVADEDVEDE